MRKTSPRGRVESQDPNLHLSPRLGPLPLYRLLLNTMLSLLGFFKLRKVWAMSLLRDEPELKERA